MWFYLKLNSYKTFIKNSYNFHEDFSFIAEKDYQIDDQFDMLNALNDLLQKKYIQRFKYELQEDNEFENANLQLFYAIDLLIKTKNIDINLEKTIFDSFYQVDTESVKSFNYVEFRSWCFDNLVIVFNKIEELLNEKEHGFIWFASPYYGICYGIIKLEDLKNKKYLNVFEGPKCKSVELKLKIVYDTETYLVNYKTNTVFNIPNTNIRFVIEKYCDDEDITMYTNYNTTQYLLRYPPGDPQIGYILNKYNFNCVCCTTISDGFKFDSKYNKYFEISIIE